MVRYACSSVTGPCLMIGLRSLVISPKIVEAVQDLWLIRSETPWSVDYKTGEFNNINRHLKPSVSPEGGSTNHGVMVCHCLK